jgi:kumamolisin
VNPARRPARRVAGGVLAVGAAGPLLLLSLSAAPAGAATPGLVPVPQGITPAALGAAPVFPVKASTRERVSFVLKMRHETALERRVNAGIYTHFLTVGEFARGYGQPAARIRALEQYLHRFHLKTRAYADRLDVTATGTAGQFNRALSVSQSVFRTAATLASAGHAARPAVTFSATRDAPRLPKTIARYVESVLGLDTYPVFASNAVHVSPARPGPARTMTAPGRAPDGATTYTGDLRPQDFASEYHLSDLGAQWQGQGQTLGIITFAAMHPADATHFWSLVGLTTKPGRIRLDNIDGGARFGAAYDSQESTLDVEQSGGVAPQANIVVYQAPNTDFGGIDAYAAAASQDKTGSVSCSWGESETALAAEDRARAESPTLIQASDEFFLELAAQGQSSFSATGDSGAYAASNDLGSTNLSVQSTSDSPWTTAAGATTLPGIIPLTSTTNVTIPAERAWAWDWRWPYFQQFGYGTEAAFAIHSVTGSTGGYSSAEPRPGYQSLVPGISTFHAVPYLRPVTVRRMLGTSLREPTSWRAWDATSLSAVPPAAITGTRRTGRVVPDLSADGDPYTGYELYYGTVQDGWGGTSFVAPQLNGAAAVIASALNRRTGFWNPEIYRLARSVQSPFTPLGATGGDNDNVYYTGTADAIYNPATGLGTPDLAAIGQAFAGL